MAFKRFDLLGRQVILHTEGLICSSPREMLGSSVFRRIVSLYCDSLQDRQSPLIEPFAPPFAAGQDWMGVADFLRAVAENPLETVVRVLPCTEHMTAPDVRAVLNDFVQELYNFWRRFDRYVVLHSEPGPSSMDRRPYRAFNATIEGLSHIVRAAYRDIAENITGDHPNVYRQVAAGCNIGLIAAPRALPLPSPYAELLEGIPIIRQIWMTPPMIMDPPTNTRSGQFVRVNENPLARFRPERTGWLCYPARVGPMVVHVCFHARFMGLGCALANLFELATDEQLAQPASALYFYGVPPAELAHVGDPPTVFFDDEAAGLIVGAVPGDDRFGYFGYLKKMILTLHNASAMKRGLMPFHGAMVRIALREGPEANVLIIGDTATGKSESLEALRLLGGSRVRQIRVVADDMGSLRVGDDGRLVAYGTEIGAFVRLDDLQRGYVFGQVDRAIIMSPHRTNARVVLPVTTLAEVLAGASVDLLLYANNHEPVGPDTPAIEPFSSAERAFEVFREGQAMSKGTTTATGLTRCYFANVFGPPQYLELHDRLARRVFEAAYASGVYVGQVRTQLGIAGMEASGPQGAAEALLELIAQRGAG